MQRILMTLVTFMALAGCSQPTEPAPATEETAPAPVAEAPQPEAAPAEEALPTEEQLPVAEDFESEFASAITPKNYGSELDALEKELETEE